MQRAGKRMLPPQTVARAIFNPRQPIRASLDLHSGLSGGSCRHGGGFDLLQDATVREVEARDCGSGRGAGTRVRSPAAVQFFVSTKISRVEPARSKTRQAAVTSSSGAGNPQARNVANVSSIGSAPEVTAPRSHGAPRAGRRRGVRLWATGLTKSRNPHELRAVVPARMLFDSVHVHAANVDKVPFSVLKPNGELVGVVGSGRGVGGSKIAVLLWRGVLRVRAVVCA